MEKMSIYFIENAQEVAKKEFRSNLAPNVTGAKSDYTVFENNGKLFARRGDLHESVKCDYCAVFNLILRNGSVEVYTSKFYGID